MMKTLLSLTLAAVVLALSFSKVAAQQQVCTSIPDEATAVETVIIQNQCQILQKLEHLVPRITAIENRISNLHPVSEADAFASVTGTGYVVFNPGNGTSTGGNPCSSDGLLAQSCNNYIQDLMNESCWDGKCSPLFAPRVNDTTPLWRDYLTDGTANPLDILKLSTEMLRTPGAVTMNGDAIILNMDGFLGQANPADITQ